MFRADAVRAVEVRDCARNLEDAVVGAGAQAHAADGHFQRPLACFERAALVIPLSLPSAPPLASRLCDRLQVLCQILLNPRLAADAVIVVDNPKAPDVERECASALSQ